MSTIKLEYTIDVSHEQCESGLYLSEILTSVVCSQSYRNTTVGDVISFNSPGYPEDILPRVVCIWHVSSQSDVWYKILAVTHNLNLFVPALHPPQNISILTSNKVFHISWDLQSTDFFDFTVVMSYFTYPFNGTWTEVILESNTTGHVIDTSKNRGQKYGITLFLRSQYGESTHTEIIDARSDKPTNPPHDVDVITRSSSIILSWKRPMDRPQVIQHYIVKYQIGRYSADHMMKITPNKTYLNIATAESQGQMFAFKIASETNGGVGHFSKAAFIRAACGVTKFILPRQSKIIIFPGHSQAPYLPNVQCTWSLNTGVSLWFKINIDTLNLEHSDGCQKDYLQVGNSTFCGSLYNKEIVQRINTVKIMFVSDGDIGGIGFILSVSAVGTPPDKPRNISIIPATYGLVVTWERPLYKSDFIQSYSLFYEHEYTSKPVKILLSKQQLSYVIDTTKYPGIRFEIWMISNGDGGTSSETSHVSAFSGCGENINLSNTSSFIITPFYGKWRPRDAFCKWHVTSHFSFLLHVIDVQFPQSNSSRCDHVTGQCNHVTNRCDGITLEISNNDKICDQQGVMKTYIIHEKEADISLTARNNVEVIKLFLKISSIELMDTTSSAMTKQSVLTSGEFLPVLLRSFTTNCHIKQFHVRGKFKNTSKH
ncbi:unnamed protein product [Mytilus coruscus]|uniref:Uncharacterized protein n=1 Tax=Mytilus coruscus TaxID=42192 RepID=A0A6J8B5L3_MYTCO|nr:unnamed protein product [Mytilus coruscus]